MSVNVRSNAGENAQEPAETAQQFIEVSNATPAEPDEYSLPSATSAAHWYDPRTWRRHPQSSLTVDEIVLDGARFDHALKKTFGRVILWLVIVQVALSNVMILCHFFFGMGADVENTVLIAWITGTVVESVGLMAVVTKYLFSSDKRPMDLPSVIS
ncbi:hypothetical protein [Microbacterium aerolatum]|uniref:hypothetical protein n=1 Tax=Microbacterium aerolatum TaxID=153731 RepID=UPI0038507A21